MAGRSRGAGLRGFGLVPEGGERNLSGVQKPCPVCIPDGADHHAVGDASNKVADALIARKRRHGVAIGLSSNLAGKVFFLVLGVLGLESAVPGVAAECYGGNFAGGAGLVSSARFGWDLDGLDHAGFSVYGGYALDDSIVRGRRELIGKQDSEGLHVGIRHPMSQNRDMGHPASGEYDCDRSRQRIGFRQDMLSPSCDRMI